MFGLTFVGFAVFASAMDGQVVVKRERPDSSPELQIVEAKPKAKVSEKRRGQIREAEKNRKNRVRSRRSAKEIEKLEQEKAEMAARLEKLQLGQQHEGRSHCLASCFTHKPFQREPRKDLPGKIEVFEKCFEKVKWAGWFQICKIHSSVNSLR